MVRLLRFAILLGCISVAGSAFATTYYIATNGSDSNNGTSTSTPWLHAPGMSGCSANCASKTPAAGDRFILRGGDVWHYNAAAGVKGLPWSISGTGTSANQIYYGVDQTWFSGSAWSRPVLTGDNPTSKTAVSACASGAINGNNNNMVDVQTSWATIDDFELTGFCWNGPNPWFGTAYFSVNGQNTTFKNIYIHGWTHTAGAGSQAVGWVGSTDGRVNNWDSVVVDGADSDPTSLCSICFNGTNIKNSVFRYNSNQVISGLHTLINNLYENISEPYDGAHGNLMEVNYEASGTNFIYNNLARNSPQVAVGWSTCPSGATDYYFNNVTYNLIMSTNSWNLPGIPDATCSANGIANYFYNSMNLAQVGDSRSGVSRIPANFNSNLMFSTNIVPAAVSVTNQVSASATTLASYGYSSANNFVPTSPDCNGNASAAGCPIGKGANLTAMCTTLNGLLSGAGTALCSDSTMGPNYDSVKHRVVGNARTPIARPTTSAWDVGAFQYTTVVADKPAPPSGLTVVVR